MDSIWSSPFLAKTRKQRPSESRHTPWGAQGSRACAGTEPPFLVCCAVVSSGSRASSRALLSDFLGSVSTRGRAEHLAHRFLTAGFPTKHRWALPGIKLGAMESSELNFLQENVCCQAGSPGEHFSCMTHRVFRDPAPFKGDLFTSMCRFLGFYSGLWGGWSIYSECMGLS